MATRPARRVAASGGWLSASGASPELALVACFLAPSLTIFFLYRLLPLGWNVLLSFQAWSPLKAGGVDRLR